jgi:hypothetical protein
MGIRTGRVWTTCTDRGMITSTSIRTRMSRDRGRREATARRPERWSEQETSTPAPPTLPRARVAVNIKVVGARERSHPRTRVR